MSITNKLYAILSLAIVGIVATLAFTGTITFGDVKTTAPTQSNNIERYTFFATTTDQTVFSTTTTAVSTSITPWYNTTTGRADNGYFVVAGADEVVFEFTRGGTQEANTGSTAFTVQGSLDGSTWYSVDRLQNATTTFASADAEATTVTTVTIGASTSTLLYRLTDNPWYAVRVTATETTDGEHSAKAVGIWK